MSRGIEEIISDVKSSQISEQQRREKVLEERRSDALSRIGAAAKTELGDDKDAESLLESRLIEAMNARISHAESLAALAERGNFTSKLIWWDIRSIQEQTIWKGYVFERRSNRIKFYHHSGDYVDLNVHEIAEGGYVAELFSASAITVGVSEETVLEAAQGAYMAYLSEVADNLVRYPDEFDAFRK